jgi:hypothetical protein
MPANASLHWPDLRRQTWQQRRCNAGNEDSSTLVITPARCRQGCQCDAKEKAIAASAGPLKAKLPWTNAVYSDEATGNYDERGIDASPATSRDCVMTGQMPVRDAGSDAGATRVTTLAQQGGRCRRNAGSNDGAMLAMTPVCVAKHSAGKDANAASGRPSKAKLPWNNVGYSNKATGKKDDHNDNATYADMSRPRCGWADTSLQCWRQCGGNEGGNASAMRAKTPSKTQAMTPAQHQQ